MLHSTARWMWAAALASGLITCETETPMDGQQAGIRAEASGETPPDETPPDERVSDYTYYQHIEPILEARCVPCHDGGGVGRLALDDYDHVEVWAMPSAHAIAARTMPPSPPSDRGRRPLDHPRDMPDGEREMFLDWVESGMPEGDPSAPIAVDLDHGSP